MKSNLFGLDLLEKSRGNKVFWLDVRFRWCYNWGTRWVLHDQKILQGCHFRFIGTVSHCSSLRGKSTSSHPVTVLLLLLTNISLLGKKMTENLKMKLLFKVSYSTIMYLIISINNSLTVSKRRQISLIPSESGTKSLMAYFLVARLTSG